MFFRVIFSQMEYGNFSRPKIVRSFASMPFRFIVSINSCIRHTKRARAWKVWPPHRRSSCILRSLRPWPGPRGSRVGYNFAVFLRLFFVKLFPNYSRQSPRAIWAKSPIWSKPGWGMVRRPPRLPRPLPHPRRHYRRSRLPRLPVFHCRQDGESHRL